TDQQQANRQSGRRTAYSVWRGMARRFSDGCDAALASCGPDMEIDGPTPGLSPASFHLFQISNLLW
ncbi:MAG: hypothetical protein J6N99_04425, partial [Schwartzia sp.]|nr:hypothetical protein [Schwartzia sp. (in: firmicutes)]